LNCFLLKIEIIILVRNIIVLTQPPYTTLSAILVAIFVEFAVVIVAVLLINVRSHYSWSLFHQ
jgi:hypothetical protein